MIIPETWDTVEEFAKWYIGNEIPFMPPSGVEIFNTDDATSFCMFKKGQFQVELYLIHPKPFVPIHEHPYVEVIETVVNESMVHLVPTLKNGQAHGVGIRDKAEEKGYALVSIQRWHPKFVPTTVSVQWRGKTAGPLHEALIKRFYPNAYINNGYADVTRKMTDVEYC
jgi:hypothetical protein